MVSVHLGPKWGFQPQEGNQVARDQGEAEYEAGHPPVTWTRGGHVTSVLMMSGQGQKSRLFGLMHGLV